MTANKKKDFFISYNKNDRKWAVWIAWTLEENNYTTVIQAWDFRAGGNFAIDMQKASAGSLRTIAVLSQHYLDAKFTQAEWAAAFAQDPTGEKRLFIPVRIDKCNLEGVQAPNVYIDLIGLTRDQAVKTLLIGVSDEERPAKPETEPHFPGVASPAKTDEPEFPGEPARLPDGSRMPFIRNAVFTGRDDDLKALAKALLHEPNAKAVGITQPVGAIGMGGIGKTQLAVEFCYRYGRFFRGVHWVNAGDIKAEIATCGAQLGIEPWPKETDAQVALTLRHWKADQPRLIIVDNADKIEGVKEWVTQLQDNCVLITSRIQDWPKHLGLSMHQLGILEREESLLLLRRLAPRLEKVDDSELDAVAKRLGDLPLALELAGAYLNDVDDLTPAEYIAELDEVGTLAHDSLTDWMDDSPTDHETNVAETFLVSWRRLTDDKVDSLAKRLFCMSGFCAPNTPIPLEIFEQATFSRTERWREVASDEDYQIRFPRITQIARRVLGETRGRSTKHSKLLAARRRLRRLGLWMPSDDGPSIHPLMSECAKREASQRDLRNICRATFYVARKAHQTQLPLKFVPLTAHVERVARIAEDRKLPVTRPLWHALARHRFAVGEYPAAAVAFGRELVLAERALGPNHPTVGALWSDLGGVFYAQGHLDRARECYERATYISETALGKDSFEVARIVNCFGLVLQAQGNHLEAIEHHKRALQIFEMKVGRYHRDTAAAVNSLGAVLQAQGDIEGAKKLFQRALDIIERTSGPDHPHYAASLSNLATVVETGGDPTRATNLYERALKISEISLGPSHPHVATILWQIGTLFRDTKDHQGARTHIQRALKIWQDTLPDDHPNIEMARECLKSLDS